MHGMCHQQRTVERAHESAPTPVRRAPEERVTTADREATAALLREAFADGILHVQEFDERLTAAYAAGVAGELQALTADLPRDWLDGIAARERAERRARIHRKAWRAQFGAYAGVMALLVAIWALTSLSADEMIHPWPVWPALGWGLPLYFTRPRGPIGAAIRRHRVARVG